MRLKKYLLENTESIDVLYKECSDFMSEWKKCGLEKGALYRGVDTNNIKIKKMSTPLFRLAKDNDQIVSDFADKVYRQSVGINLRTKATFCTHNKNSAKAYGQLYYVVPTNGYSLFCNPKIRDLFVDVFSTIEEPQLCKKGKELDSSKIALNTIGKDGLKITKEKKNWAILDIVANKILRPYLLAYPKQIVINAIKASYKDKQKIQPDNTLFEFFNIFNKKNKEIKKELKEPLLKSVKDEFGNTIINAEESYDLFWKFALNDLEKEVIKLLNNTKKMSLNETSNYKDNEIHLITKEYYLVDTNLINF